MPEYTVMGEDGRVDYRVPFKIAVRRLIEAMPPEDRCRPGVARRIERDVSSLRPLRYADRDMATVAGVAICRER